MPLTQSQWKQAAIDNPSGYEAANPGGGTPDLTPLQIAQSNPNYVGMDSSGNPLYSADASQNNQQISNTPPSSLDSAPAGSGVGSVAGITDLTLPSYATSTDPNDYINQVNSMASAEKAARESQIRGDFGNQISDVEATGKSQESGAEALSARAGGLGASSIKEGMISGIEKDTKASVADLTSKMEAAIIAGDTAAFTNAKSLYDSALALQDKTFQAKITLANEKLQAISTIGSVAANVPKGTSVNVAGQTIEGTGTPTPVYKGSDLVNIMKNMTPGATQEITDPATGQKYSLTGIGGGTGTMKQYQITDAKTKETYIVNYNTQTHEITKTDTGLQAKGSTSSSSTSVKSISRMYDNKTYIGNQITDKNGAVRYTDVNGKAIATPKNINSVRFDTPVPYAETTASGSGSPDAGSAPAVDNSNLDQDLQDFLNSQ